jgi:hypothetical protein
MTVLVVINQSANRCDGEWAVGISRRAFIVAFVMQADAECRNRRMESPPSRANSGACRISNVPCKTGNTTSRRSAHSPVIKLYQTAARWVAKNRYVCISARPFHQSQPLRFHGNSLSGAAALAIPSLVIAMERLRISVVDRFDLERAND